MAKFYRVLELGFVFLLAFTMFSNLTGTFYSYFNIRWGLDAFLFNVVLACIPLYFVAKSEKGIVFFENKKSAWFSSVLFLLSLYYFGRWYAPILEVRQDPSVYLFKSLNLLNWGYINKPLTTVSELINESFAPFHLFEGYAKIANGAQFFQSGELVLDFYPGGTYFYALIGLLSKKLVFYGPAIIMGLTSVMIFKLFSHASNELTAFIMALVYLICPLTSWFGRGPFSEPIATLMFLCGVYFLNHVSTYDKLGKMVGALLILILSYAIRIDYIFCIFAGILIAFRFSTVVGVSYFLVATVFLYLTKDVFYIYSNRLSADSFLFKYDYYLLQGVAAVGYLSSKIKALDWSKIFSSSGLKVLMWLMVLTVVMLVFRDDFVGKDNFDFVYNHNKNIRSYNEEIFERLFWFVPGFLMVVGLLSFPRFLQEAKFSVEAKFYICALVIPLMYYFWDMSNSPQLYWSIRRYTYVLIPAIFLFFTFFVQRLGAPERRICLAAVFILSLNLLLGAEQNKQEYRGLDKSVQKFIDIVPEDDGYLIAYDPELKYWVSSILSYGKYDQLPVFDKKLLVHAVKDLNKKVVYISKEPQEFDINPIKNVSYLMEFRKTGENYDRIPKGWKSVKRKMNLAFYQ